jgi:hypothetical protein
MKVHDYHLRGYEVGDFGSVVALDLVYDYPAQPKCETRVRFSGVELYHFSHTTGTIIFGIEQIPLATLLDEQADFIRSAAHMQGVKGWKNDIETYSAYLLSAGVCAWEITSSIGFDGFVIARAIELA